VTRPTVAVVADDLIWADRLHRLVSASGAQVEPCRSLVQLESVLGRVDAVVVDLGARTFDPQASIACATEASKPTLAVGPHDAAEGRAQARASGADRVLAYRALAEPGSDAIGRWLSGVDRPAPVETSR